MTAPVKFCLCAHPRSVHYRGKGGCSRTVCSCGEYRESPVPTATPVLEFDPRASGNAAREAG